MSSSLCQTTTFVCLLNKVLNNKFNNTQFMFIMILQNNSNKNWERSSELNTIFISEFTGYSLLHDDDFDANF